mmetsp:Transcript_94823/g.149994  ORF Transcript_94823/g.149994 Transcript_94823/m.149994 type:complete len:171 (-) Transcript_94823:68-580(-)|eukprot:CAMPEP_0169081470 /NCGR_PEP_ID=MMETSP1015-20121227/11028_1 /TAXON_ID=342587 /ORGANISM="Karlodinium micrum, Strain CCMP2283" /LENGTH=170 /DNA_ID=CAMNT_0009141261 /DNA_START=80 /DNA_END=592 /DNA_ORIENTATION=-
MAMVGGGGARASPSESPLPPPSEPPMSAGGEGARSSRLFFNTASTDALTPPRALSQVGRGVVKDARHHEEFLRGWTAERHSTAPYATDYFTRVPAMRKEVRFSSRSLTAERVLGREPPMGMKVGSSLTSSIPLRDPCRVGYAAAGQTSGHFNCDFGRIGLMNGRYGSRAL